MDDTVWLLVGLEGRAEEGVGVEEGTEEIMVMGK